MTLSGRLHSGIGWLVALVAAAAFFTGRRLLFVDGAVDAAEVMVGGIGLLAVCGMFPEKRETRPISVLIQLGLSCYLLGGGFSMGNVALAICFVASAVFTWLLKGRSNEDEDDEPMLSLVLLMKEPRYLDAMMLQRFASDAWGIEVALAEDEEDDEDGNDELDQGGELNDARPTLFGEEAPFMCMYWPALLVIHNADSAYFDDVDSVLEEIQEGRVAESVREHRAWMSVDLLSWLADEEPHPEAVDRLIGQLLAEFADEDCLAVIDLVTGQIYPSDPETAEKLRSRDPREALSKPYFASMVTISADDPEMLKAVETAKQRWPEFVAAFEQRTEEEHFGVKSRFEQDDNAEFIWMLVTAIEADIIYGELGNEPVHVTSLKINDQVRVPLKDLNDWLHINADGEHAGGFTIDVLTQRQRNQDGR